jgi:hypothetical protein
MSASKLHADDTPVPVLAPETARRRLAAAIRNTLSRWRALTRWPPPDRQQRRRTRVARRRPRTQELSLRRIKRRRRTSRRHLLPARLSQAQRPRSGDLFALVIEWIADHPITQIDQLLPWNVPSLTIRSRLNRCPPTARWTPIQSILLHGYSHKNSPDQALTLQRRITQLNSNLGLSVKAGF